MPLDLSGYFESETKRKGLDLSGYFDDPQPDTTLPDFGSLRFDPDVPQPAVSTRVAPPPQRPEGIQPPPTSLALGIAGAGAGESLVNTVKRLTSGALATRGVPSPFIEETGAQEFAAGMRPIQTLGQNIGADILGAVPYAIPHYFLTELATRPETIPDLLKSISESHKDVRAAIDPFIQKSPLKTFFGEKSEEEVAVARERIRQHPLGTAFDVALPITLGAGGARGARAIETKAVKRLGPAGRIITGGEPTPTIKLPGQFQPSKFSRTPLIEERTGKQFPLVESVPKNRGVLVDRQGKVKYTIAGFETSKTGKTGKFVYKDVGTGELIKQGDPRLNKYQVKRPVVVARQFEKPPTVKKPVPPSRVIQEKKIALPRLTPKVKRKLERADVVKPAPKKGKVEPVKGVDTSKPWGVPREEYIERQSKKQQLQKDKVITDLERQIDAAKKEIRMGEEFEVGVKSGDRTESALAAFFGKVDVGDAKTKLKELTTELNREKRESVTTGAEIAHRSQVREALKSGKLTIEQAEQLGHFKHYPRFKTKYSPTELGAVGAPRKGKIEERHAGVNPFSFARKLFQRAFGARGEPGGRRLVSPIGTPEITLAGRGIVEPFHEAKPLLEAKRTDLGKKATSIFEGIKKRSPEDQAMFNRLNDPNAKLQGKELQLRQYFDNLLESINKHRAARGQELVKRRKGYITHIIDFAKEQQGLFQDLPIPKSLRFAFEKRKGGQKFGRSAIEATEIYTEAALRDVYYGDALMKAIPEVEKLTLGKSKPIITTKTETLPTGKKTTKHFYDLGGAVLGTERAYAEAFIKGQLGWPTNFQRAVSTIFRINPKTQMKASQAVTAGFYKSLIGAALDTSVKNMTQIVNTISEFRAIPTLKGAAKFITPKGIREAKKQNLLGEFNPLLHGGEDLKLTGKFGEVAKAIDKTVIGGPMRFAEFVLRGTTYHTAMDVYLKQGHSIEVANRMARDVIRKTQFAYGKQNISPYVRGPVGRALFQFFSFPLKQSELMYRWATEGKGGQAKLIRYFAITGALTLGGKYAGIDLSNIFLDPIKMIDPDSKEGFKLPLSDKRAKLSFEKLKESGFIPFGPAPVISAPLKVGRLALSKDEFLRKKALTEAIKVFIPGGRYGSKVAQTVRELQGDPLTGRRGRIIRKPTTKEAVLRLAGLRPSESEIIWGRRNSVKEIEDDYYAKRQKVIDLVIEGKGEDARKVVQEIVDKYPYLAERLTESLTLKAINQEALKKKMTTEQRFYDPTIRKIIRQGITRD